MKIGEGRSPGHRILRVLVWILLPYLILGTFYLLVVFRLQLRPINDVVRVTWSISCNNRRHFRKGAVHK